MVNRSGDTSAGGDRTQAGGPITPREIFVSKEELKQLAASAAAATADLRVEAQAAWGLGAQARALTPLNTNTPLLQALTQRVKKLERLDVAGEKLERLEQACRVTGEGEEQLKGSVQSLDRRVQQLEVSSAVAGSRLCRTQPRSRL